ncbi:hypothetical protein [Nocardioides stalactiti]|nr:hypothetical protein [Nocardioides stalactiti]
MIAARARGRAGRPERVADAVRRITAVDGQPNKKELAVLAAIEERCSRA